MIKVIRWTVVGIVVAFLTPVYALAYIDPGTGSYLIQLLIAAFVAISFSIKIFWKKIVRLFSKKSGPDGQDGRKSDESSSAP
ncbi:MAG: hypothetical protein ACYDH0_04855 [Candidatus Aminicenantales bacterium]